MSVVTTHVNRDECRDYSRGAEWAFCSLDFSADGELLASVGSSPDYSLTVWDWRQEEILQSCKAVSQDVYRVSFSPHTTELLISCGSSHIKFWKNAPTFTGLKLQGLMGNFGKVNISDIDSYVVLPDGKVVSGTEWGNLLLWDGNLIMFEICRKEGRSCHTGTALPFALDEGTLLTMGADGAVRSYFAHGHKVEFQEKWHAEVVVSKNVDSEHAMEIVETKEQGGFPKSLVLLTVGHYELWDFTRR
uniref:EML-like first beta-propeller domain-containing protein n=1 Tax=Knipowitschia caucasica TaxID=637954 RepID=A0AAV2IT23_KNICA